jgi:hypothetical protein
MFGHNDHAHEQNCDSNTYDFVAVLFQSENQDQVCGFIESLEDNNYDESGQINLSNLYFDKSKWANIHEYSKVMSPIEIFGLIFSISLFLVLMVYSCYLRSALLRKEPVDGSIPTHPRQKFPRFSTISRINSGIMAARSYWDHSWDDTNLLTLDSMASDYSGPIRER